MFRDRYGCRGSGRAGQGIDDPGGALKLAAVSRAASETTGTEPRDGCVFAALHDASEHLAELTSAMGAAADYHVPMDATLGRDLTCIDHAAIAAYRAARNAAAESDRLHRERARKAAEKAK